MRPLLLLSLLLFPAAAGAADPVAISGADTAWMLVGAALVLFMTIPGLALFYAGLVRAKNALSVLMQCFAITAAVSVLWILVGYGIAFGAPGEGWQSVIGGFDRWWGRGLTADSVHPLYPTVPEPVFCLFQMTFAIITPALLVGAFAERIRFSAALLLCCLWMLVVYAPLAHMTWGGPGALLGDWGVFDTAGGLAVETASGVGALVAALMIGRRLGYGEVPMPPHNMVMCATGAAFLWVGWFGFNAGGVVPVGGGTGLTALNTHLAACMAGGAWAVIEWVRNRKASVLGITTGAVAGLVGITPAASFVGIWGALAIGAVAGGVSYLAVVELKRRFQYDDTLDVFGVHGVAGIVGTLLTGVFAATAFGGQKEVEPLAQLWIQAKALAVAIAWSAIGTLILAWIVDRVLGLRAPRADERDGLDLTHHGEVAYIIEERS